jgi:hypothetical protein
MNWRFKSAALQLLERLPLSDALYYLLQRKVTRSLPRSVSRIHRAITNNRRHIDAFRSRGIDLGEGVLVSFGAGWDLCENLIFYSHGVNRQIALDVEPLARIDLINGLAAYLDANPLEGFARRPFPPLERNARADLLQRYGIDYRAPADARAVPMPQGSVDMIATTNTLEHIPRDSLVAIMKECRRLVTDSGAVSMKIDYSDHFAHSDPSITIYNFFEHGLKVLAPPQRS